MSDAPSLRESSTLQLPYPPSANRLWRAVNGRNIKSREYRDWLDEAGWAIRQQKPPAIKGHYRLTISAVRPDRRARDIGNLEKPISDCLVSAGVIEDDHLAKSIMMLWSEAEPVKGGLVSVIVEAA